MRSFLLAMAVLALGADVAQAQIIRPVRVDRPAAWTSLGLGYLQQQGVCDDATNACWDFGDTFQWRASLEFPVGTGATLGIAGTMARLPLTYRGAPLTERSCVQCDADANVSQILANFHIGGGVGFHQAIDLSLGYTFFSNFRGTDGTPLGPEKAVDDFTLALGYGFGYNFSSRAGLVVAQDLALVMHGRQSGSSSSFIQQRTLRVGGRVALGGR